jgi:hypothetical protein
MTLKMQKMDTFFTIIEKSCNDHADKINTL